MKQQKKKKGRSVQELIGIKTFTKYGLSTNKGELLFYLVSPTNISVLSHTNIEIKIRHLMMVLSALPDIEIVCTDSSECFDDNKAYLTERLEVEENAKVRKGKYYAQKKTESIDAGAGRGNPHQGLLRHDPARHYKIFIRPLYRRRQLPLCVGNP